MGSRALVRSHRMILFLTSVLDSIHKERAIPLPQMALYGNAAVLSSAMSAVDCISGYGLLQTTRFRQRLLERPVQLKGPELDNFERRPARSTLGALPQFGRGLEAHFSMTLRADRLQHFFDRSDWPSSVLPGQTLSPSCAIAVAQPCKARSNRPPSIPSLYNPWRESHRGGIRLAVMANGRDAVEGGSTQAG